MSIRHHSFFRIPARGWGLALAVLLFADVSLATQAMQQRETEEMAAASLARSLTERLRHGYRSGSGTRIEYGSHDDGLQLQTHTFRLSDLRLIETLAGYRALQAWEDDREDRVVRKRTLSLPRDDEWIAQPGSQTLTHRSEHRQANAAVCATSPGGQCSSLFTVFTQLEQARSGLRLTQQLYVNGEFAEQVRWELTR